MKNAILAQLEIAINGATATVSNADKVFESNLPAGLTLEVVKQSNNYQEEFHAALTEASLPKMVDGMKSDLQLGLMTLEANVCGRDYGVVLTRPTMDNPTEQNYSDGIACYVKVPVSKSVTESVARAAALWSN